MSLSPSSRTSWGPVEQSRSGITMVVAICMALPAISARLAPFTLATILFLSVVLSLQTRTPVSLRPKADLLGLSIVAFLSYAAVSILWSIDTGVSVSKVALMISIAAGALAISRLVSLQSADVAAALANGLWIGLLAGTIYLNIELLSGQAIKRTVVNAIGIAPGALKPHHYYTWTDGRLASAHSMSLQRNFAILPLLLWPALAAAAFLVPGRSALVRGVLMASCALAVMIGPHATSKLALAAGFVTFAAMQLAPRLTSRAAAAAWVAACMLVVPAALLAHKLDLHNASWLPMSAQHRIIIWNHTAELTAKAPILGIGASSTQVLGPQLDPVTVSAPGEAWSRKLSRHAHNVFLQTWFELGLVGASLLALFGIAANRRLAGLPGQMRSYGVAQFVSAAALSATSFGMWQAWFLATFGLALVGYSITTRLAAAGSADEAS